MTELKDMLDRLHATIRSCEDEAGASFTTHHFSEWLEYAVHDDDREPFIEWLIKEWTDIDTEDYLHDTASSWPALFKRWEMRERPDRWAS